MPTFFVAFFVLHIYFFRVENFYYKMGVYMQKLTKNYDYNVNLSRVFSGCLLETNYVYTYEGDDYKNVKHVVIEYTEDLGTEFESKSGSAFNFSSSSSNGSGKHGYSVNNSEEWDKTITINDTNSNLDYKKLMNGYNSTRKIAVYVDGKLVDTFTVEVDI